HTRSKRDWSSDVCSSDLTEVNKYIEDENCGFICTSGFFTDLLHGINTIHKRKEIEKTPKDLPIYFIAGDADPVGNHGKGVKKTYERSEEHTSELQSRFDLVCRL